MKKADLEYYKNLPRKRVGAGALIFDKDGKLLIVKPDYRDHWLIPGGVAEKNESPKDACLRETREEIGLELDKIELICIDHISDNSIRGDVLLFFFEGGELNEQQIKNIKLQKGEIVDYKFVNIDEALLLLSQALCQAMPRCMEAIRENRVVYFEDRTRV